MAQAQVSQLVERYGYSVIYMLTGGFEHLVSGLGGKCLGISLRSTEGDALLVVRAEFDGVRMVAFQGAATGAGAIRKVEREIRKGTLRWRPDRFSV